MNRVILLSVTTAVLLTFNGCNDSDETSNRSVATAKVDTDKTKEMLKKRLNKTAKTLKESAKKSIEESREITHKVAEAVKEDTKEVAKATKKVIKRAKVAVANAVENAKGAALYSKCKSCHGANGRIKALGKSEIIAGQNAEDLVKKITEYKAGTRNVSGMGQLMKGQVGSLSDEDIKTVSTYISNLK